MKRRHLFNPDGSVRMTIKAPVTERMALVDDSGSFLCGIDTRKTGNRAIVLANYPHIYGYTFERLVGEIVRYSDEEYLDEADSLTIIDDSEQFCCEVETIDDGWGECEEQFVYDEGKHRECLVDLDTLAKLLRAYPQKQELLAEQAEYLNGKPLR